MNISATQSGIKIENVRDFNPLHTFTCGQCFRWEQEEDSSFTGVAHGKVLNVKLENKTLYLNNTDISEFNSLWKNYFDFDRDYTKIKKTLSNDPFLKTATEFGSGIRILKQDFFETLVSFIISANNNIPRIQKIINIFSKMYGEKLSYNGKEYYAFPSPENLSGITKDDLAPLHAGYRADYLADTINKFYSLSFDKINSMPLDEAKKVLCSLKGVGPKVCDCILLFAFAKFEVFPTDVWVKRVMNELYGCEENLVTRFGMDKFGHFSGLAQQYLFYWRRGA